MDKILEIKGLTVKKFHHKIIDDLSFTLYKGETLAVVGPNGAGKTTLFQAITGLTDYEGEVIWAPNLKIGYVPQRFYVDSDLPLTTEEFFKLKNAKNGEIEDALNSVGLLQRVGHIQSPNKHILKNLLGELSGGELQRVIIAWALIGNPDVLLFDEPTSGVDVVGEETIYETLNKLKEKTGMTIVLISHELEIVRKYTSIVLCLNKEKVCYGPPQEVFTKKTLDELFGRGASIYHHEHHH